MKVLVHGMTYEPDIGNLVELDKGMKVLVVGMT